MDKKLPDVVHLLGTLNVPVSDTVNRVMYRGTDLTVSPELIERTRDRTGTSWLELADDEAAQVARWGRRLIAPGTSADANVRWWDDDEASRNLAREDAREAALRIPDPAQRAEALAAVRATYGAKHDETVIFRLGPST